MKALILDGGHDTSTVGAALCQTIAILLAAARWEVETVVLRTEKVGYCLGCFECWIKSPGLCRIDDAGRDVAADVINSDLVIFLTPITFGGYSSHLKKVVDRLICLVSPFFTQIDGEVHHKARYAQYPALLGVGMLPQPDDEQTQIFSQLIARNSINLHTPFHAIFVTSAPQFDEQQLTATLTALIQSQELKA